MTSAEVRSELVKALELDLIGPRSCESGELGDPGEVLSQPPSRWYLAGFLAPTDSDPSQNTDEGSNEEVDEAADGGGLDDDSIPDKAAAKNRVFPSSMGLSVLVPPDIQQLHVTVIWGDYTPDASGGDNWTRHEVRRELDLDVPTSTEKPSLEPSAWRVLASPLRPRPKP